MTEGVEIGNIEIPLIKGEDGKDGSAGKISSLQITMLPSESIPTVTNTGTAYDAKYILGIPMGTSVESAHINTNELVITLTNGTEINVGTVVGTSILDVIIDNEYNLLITLTDGTEINAGNLEDNLSGIVSDYLQDYYDKDTADGKFALITKSAKAINTSYNASTNKLTAKLKDLNGTVISTDEATFPNSIVALAYSSGHIGYTKESGATGTVDISGLVSGLQTEITNANKLSADLVTDTNTTNKFVTSTEKTKISNSITASDYATSGTGGTIKIGNGLAINDGVINPQSISGETAWTTSSMLNQFVSVTTAKNMINYKIGDIDSALDLLNGESI